MELQSIGFEAIDALKPWRLSAAGATAGFVSYGAVGALATASTGAAISGLSGVAAANATLAWFGVARFLLAGSEGRRSLDSWLHRHRPGAGHWWHGDERQIQRSTSPGQGPRSGSGQSP